MTSLPKARAVIGREGEELPLLAAPPPFDSPCVSKVLSVSEPPPPPLLLHAGGQTHAFILHLPSLPLLPLTVAPSAPAPHWAASSSGVCVCVCVCERRMGGFLKEGTA